MFDRGNDNKTSFCILLENQQFPSSINNFLRPKLIKAKGFLITPTNTNNTLDKLNTLTQHPRVCRAWNCSASTDDVGGGEGTAQGSVVQGGRDARVERTDLDRGEPGGNGCNSEVLIKERLLTARRW